MNDESTFADRIIEFNRTLSFPQNLPEDFAVLNPFQDNEEVLTTMEIFYRKFYNDHQPRKFLIGINPGRFGAGITGVPFTDTKRLQSICNIEINAKSTHEVSSVFVYNMIEQYGGVEKFYKEVYINSVFPLAIIRKNAKGNWLNCNYYDDKKLFEITEPYMADFLKKQIEFGIDKKRAFALGKKNATFLHKINEKEKLFKEIIPLEHPRYIQQYKFHTSQLYIDKYIETLNK